MIDVHERFEVPAPPDQVWAVLSDPAAVVGCVPGASLGAQHEDGSFDAGLTVKFGPLRVTFNATVRLDLKPVARTGRLAAQGRDSQGGTRVRAEAAFAVMSVDVGSMVSVDGGVEISGKLASLIEGGAAAVVQRMSNEFAEQLAARCGGCTA